MPVLRLLYESLASGYLAGETTLLFTVRLSEAKMSDLQRRSEALLQKRGYLTGSCERRKTFPAKGKTACRACGHLPQISISQDLWNIFDLIAIRPVLKTQTDWVDGLVTFVQVTSSANHAARRNKIIASPEAKLCLLAGARILIQSWKKVQNRYQAHDEWISADQFVFGLPDTVEQHYEDLRRQKMVAREPGYTLPLSDGLKDSEIPF